MSLELTIFEDLAIADKEKIHTQVLNYVLNNKNITTQSKISFLGALVGSNYSLSKINIKQITITAITECSNIDLQIDIKQDSELIVKFVFENKLKSSLHSNQLNKYKEIIDNDSSLGNVCKYFIFLTLAGKYAQDDWKPLSFESYASAFGKFELANTVKNNISVYLEDYKKTLNNLIKSYNWFMDNPKLYPITSKAKLMHDINDVKTYDDYIRKFQLSTIFTKNYYLAKLSEIDDKPWTSIEIEETRGNALFNLILHEYNSGAENHGRLFLQGQNGTIKLAFGLKDFKGKKKFISDSLIHAIFEEFFNDNKYLKCRFNEPEKNGYISISIGKYAENKNLSNLGDEIMLVFNEHKEKIGELNGKIDGAYKNINTLSCNK